MAKDGSRSGRGGLFDLFSWAVNWTEDPERQLLLLSPEQITIDNHQPRRHFDQEGLESLARSIRANGVIEPVLVRKLDNGNYQLIAGERRLRAARLAGSQEIPAVVSALTRESDIKKFQLIENLMRKDLNPVEEVYAYLDLISSRIAADRQAKELLAAGLAERRIKLAEFLRRLAKEQKKSPKNRTSSSNRTDLLDKISAVFEEIGHTTLEEFVERRLQVLSLPPEVLTALGEGWLSYEQARALSRITQRSFGESVAVKERQKMLAWIKRSSPSLEELRVRIARRRAEIAAANPQPASIATQRLNQVARRLRAIKPEGKQISRLEKALSDLEALVAKIEEKKN
jgi:ParB family transcriptional regulator, chromosome partitioning protein